jgi:hypothetical protein
LLNEGINSVETIIPSTLKSKIIKFEGFFPNVVSLKGFIWSKPLPPTINLNEATLGSIPATSNISINGMMF